MLQLCISLIVCMSITLNNSKTFQRKSLNTDSINSLFNIKSFPTANCRILLFINQNICCGYTKEPSPKHMFKLSYVQIFTIACTKKSAICTYVYIHKYVYHNYTIAFFFRTNKAKQRLEDTDTASTSKVLANLEMDRVYYRQPLYDNKNIRL